MLYVPALRAEDFRVIVFLTFGIEEDGFLTIDIIHSMFLPSIGRLASEWRVAVE